MFEGGLRFMTRAEGRGQRDTLTEANRQPNHERAARPPTPQTLAFPVCDKQNSMLKYQTYW